MDVMTYMSWGGGCTRRQTNKQETLAADQCTARIYFHPACILHILLRGTESATAGSSEPDLHMHTRSTTLADGTREIHAGGLNTASYYVFPPPPPNTITVCLDARCRRCPKDDGLPLAGPFLGNPAIRATTQTESR